MRASKPLSYQGTLLQDIEVKFEGGAIVKSAARTGADVLAKVLDTDEGARRLGEVALVPYSSPISSRRASCSTTRCSTRTPRATSRSASPIPNACATATSSAASELLAKGANASLIHIDWMIGSKDIDLDGVVGDGAKTPLMRKGEWV